MQPNPSLIKLSLHVCVDAISQGKVAGRIYSQQLTEPFCFDDIAQLLQVESILDRQDFPQAFQRKRTFTDASTTALPQGETPEEFLSLEQVEQAQGELSSFWITVLSRQNTSWQGLIFWPEAEDSVPFSSELELLRLVSDHLFPES